MATGGLGAPQPFFWGGGGERLSPQEIARRRALAESLQGPESPSTYWEGMQSLAGSVGSALHNWQADESERAGLSEYSDLLSALMEGGGGDMSALMGAMTHDFASPQGQALASTLLGEQMRQSDPMYQMNLERAGLELDALRNPWQAQPATPDQLSPWGIDAGAGGSWVIGPDGLPQQVYAPPGVTGDPFTLSPGQVRFGPDGQPIASVEDGGASLSENERQIAALIERGFSEAEAQDLAYGFVQTVVDPVLQAPMIVNRTTGEGRHITPEEAAVIGEVVGSPSADGAAPQITEGVVPPEGSLAERQPDRPPTLWEITEGSTGLVPSLQEGWTNVAGQFGVEGFTDTVENRQTFDLVKNDLIRAMSINPRFPVGEIQRLEREINISPAAWTSPNSMRARMVAINNALSRRLENEIRAAGDPQMPAEARRNALQAANDIQNFLSALGVPEGANAQTGGDASTPSSDNRPPLESFMR